MNLTSAQRIELSRAVPLVRLSDDSAARVLLEDFFSVNAPEAAAIRGFAQEVLLALEQDLFSVLDAPDGNVTLNDALREQREMAQLVSTMLQLVNDAAITLIGQRMPEATTDLQPGPTVAETDLEFPLGPRGLSELFHYLGGRGCRVRRDYRCVGHTVDRAHIAFRDADQGCEALARWIPGSDERPRRPDGMSCGAGGAARTAADAQLGS